MIKAIKILTICTLMTVVNNLTAQSSCCGGSHSGNLKDPICGMSVDEHSQFSSEFKGVKYYFCAKSCKEKFDSTPEKYAVKSADELKPEFIATGIKYSKTLIKELKFKESIPVLEFLCSTASEKEDLANIKFNLGFAHMKQKNLKLALELWKEVMDKYPGNESASGAIVNTAGITYQTTDDLDTPYNLLNDGFSKAKIFESHAPTAHKLMVMISYDKGDFNTARYHMERMNKEDIYDGHMVESIPIIYYKTGDVAKGDDFLEDYFEKIKEDPFKLYRLSAIISDADFRLKDALRWIEKADKLSNGDKFYIKDTYSSILYKLGQKTKAISELEKAISLCKRDDALSEMKAKLEKYKSVKK